MEAVDPASGHAFLEHALTGETRWKADPGGASGGGDTGGVGSVCAASNSQARHFRNGREPQIKYAKKKGESQTKR